MALPKGKDQGEEGRRQLVSRKGGTPGADHAPRSGIENKKENKVFVSRNEACPHSQPTKEADNKEEKVGGGGTTRKRKCTLNEERKTCPQE